MAFASSSCSVATTTTATAAVHQRTPSQSAINGRPAPPAHMISFASPSLSTTTESFFDRQSRADSMGTLWSSADIPLIFDGLSQTDVQRAAQRVHAAVMTSYGESSSSEQPRKLSDTSVLFSDDGQKFVAVRPTTRPTSSGKGMNASTSTGWTIANDEKKASKVAVLQRPGSSSSPSQQRTQQFRPLAQVDPFTSSSSTSRSHHAASPSQPRSTRRFDVPASISDVSQVTFSSSVASKMGQHDPMPTLDQPDLYKRAQQFFDSSYSMAATSSSMLTVQQDTSRMSRFSDDSYVTLDAAAVSSSAAAAGGVPAALGPTETIVTSVEQANVASPPRSYAPSSNSHSSAESSSGPPELGDIEAVEKPFFLHAFPRPAPLPPSPSSKGNDSQGTTPLRVAMSLAEPRERTPTQSTVHEALASAAVAAWPPVPSPSTAVSTLRRPSTTDAATTNFNTSASHQLQARPKTAQQVQHTSSTTQLGRSGSNAADKYAFLQQGPTPPSPQQSKRGALFGLRVRATSTPRLRQSRTASQDGNETDAVTNTSATMNISAPMPVEAFERELVRARTANGNHPPPAPSGRFRTATADGVGGRSRSDSTGSNASQKQHVNDLRRPSSSSDKWAAATRRFRRPSRAESNASQVDVVSGVERTRLASNASSHGFLQHAASSNSLRMTSSHGAVPVATHRRSRVGLSAAANGSRTSKGSWASYLAQGLTLHIEHGGKKYACRMNYLYYDPFGRPESLCKVSEVGRGSVSSSAGGHGGSRQGSVSHAHGSIGGGGADANDAKWPEDQVTGVLEFAPDRSECLDDERRSSTCRMTFATASTSDVILKHLTIGDDTRADLITRQANLSLNANGTLEVSGSERKGTVSWRFVFAIEEVRSDDGEIVAGVKALQPLRFSCSTTLLDPSRAKKLRLVNMIRKQMGSHIESHSIAASSSLHGVASAFSENHAVAAVPKSSPLRSAGAEPPLSPRSVPRTGAQLHHHAPHSPTQMRTKASAVHRNASLAHEQQEQHMLTALRNGSVASVKTNGSSASATWSPASRPPANLLAFKVNKSTAEALRHGEAVNLSSALAASTSPRTMTSSLTSPATSIDVGSAGSPQKSVRELGSSTASTHAYAIAKARQNVAATRAPPATALGLLETAVKASGATKDDREEVDWYHGSTAGQWAASNSSGGGLASSRAGRARRLRCATAEQQSTSSTPSRPPTASEEIKMAYLNNANAAGGGIVQRTFVKPTEAHGTNGSLGLYELPFPQTARRMTSSSIVHQSTPASTANVVRDKRLPPTPKRGLLAPLSSTNQAQAQFEAPEGPFWV